VTVVPCSFVVIGRQGIAADQVRPRVTSRNNVRVYATCTVWPTRTVKCNYIWQN